MPILTLIFSARSVASFTPVERISGSIGPKDSIRKKTMNIIGVGQGCKWMFWMMREINTCNISQGWKGVNECYPILDYIKGRLTSFVLYFLQACKNG